MFAVVYELHPGVLLEPRGMLMIAALLLSVSEAATTCDTHVPDPDPGALAALAYPPPSITMTLLPRLVLEDQERVQATNWDREPKPVPPARVVASFASSTRAAVLPEWFTLIVMGPGRNELVREAGVPGFGPLVEGGVWHAELAADLPAAATFPVDIVLWDRGAGSTCRVRMNADGEVVQSSVPAVGAFPPRTAPVSRPVPAPQPARSSTILCNDGTRSPSCTVCTRGCCSSHGGCR